MGKNTNSSFNGFFATNKGQMLQSGLSSAGSILGQASSSGLTAQQSATREGIRSAIGQFGPWGAIISAASGVVDMVGDLTGLNLDNLDQSAAERAGAGAAAGFQSFMNSLPGNSMLWGMFAGKTEKSNKSVQIDGLTSAYGQSVGDINAAQQLGNKRVLFGRGKINKFIREQNRVNNLLTNIGLEAQLAKSNTASDVFTSQNATRYSGTQPQLLLSKKGIKLPKIADIDTLLAKYEVQDTIDTTKTQDKNIIPEGALHKNKHHLEDENSSLEGKVTEKGIPVVSEENGEITQTAEIEENEIIFRKEATDILEALYTKYKNSQDDSIAIECGKYLVEEILKRTEDKTKLIKQIKV